MADRGEGGCDVQEDASRKTLALGVVEVGEATIDGDNRFRDLAALKKAMLFERASFERNLAERLVEGLG